MRARGLVGDVGSDHRDGAAECPQVFCRLVEAAGEVVVAVDRTGDDRDVGTFGREALGGGGADPAARASDDDASPSKPFHGSTAAAVIQM